MARKKKGCDVLRLAVEAFGGTLEADKDAVLMFAHSPEGQQWVVNGLRSIALIYHERGPSRLLEKAISEINQGLEPLGTPNFGHIIASIPDVGGDISHDLSIGWSATAPKGLVWAANLNPTLFLGPGGSVTPEQYFDLLGQLALGFASGDGSQYSGVTIDYILQSAQALGATRSWDRVTGEWHINAPKGQQWVSGHISFLPYSDSDVNHPWAMDAMMEEVRQGLEPETEFYDWDED